MARTKTKVGRGTSKKTLKKTAIARPDGRGALLPGGQYGNAGGGRPPSVIREKLRGSFDQRVLVLEKIADGQELGAEIGDRLKAIDMLAKYGLGTKDEMTLTTDQVKALCQSYSQQVMQIVAEIVPDAFLAIQARVEQTLAEIGA